MLANKQSPKIDLPSGSDYIDAALEGLVRLNQVVMKHVAIPALYKSGIRWRLERGPQRWRRADEVLAEGSNADCKNLAAWRAAELRNSGEDTRARAHVYKSGARMWHAVVIRGNGMVEDPSRLLGMPKRETIGGAHYAPLEVHMSEFVGGEYVGADPVRSLEMSITEEKTANGWRVTIRVPFDGLKDAKALFVHREGASKSGATKSALEVASNILKDPKVSALIPGPAKFALQLAGSKTAQKIAKGLLHLF